MKKETPFRKGTSISGSEIDVVERIVDSETSSTSSSELSDISKNRELHTVVASSSSYGRKRTRVLRDSYVPRQNIEM